MLKFSKSIILGIFSCGVFLSSPQAWAACEDIKPEYNKAADWVERLYFSFYQEVQTVDEADALNEKRMKLIKEFDMKKFLVRYKKDFLDKCNDQNSSFNPHYKKPGATSGTQMAPGVPRHEYNDGFVTEFFSDLPKEWDSGFLGQFLQYRLDQAYELRKKDAVKAAASAKNVLSIIAVIKAFDPKFKDKTGREALAQKIADEMDKALDKVFTGPFHKKMAGKIVFSTEPLKPGSENEKAVKTKFSPNDRIYGMVYFPKTLQGLGGAIYALRMSIEGGNKFDIMEVQHPSGKRLTRFAFKDFDEVLKPDSTYFFFEIVPDPKISDQYLSLRYLPMFEELSPRTHTVNFALEGVADVHGGAIERVTIGSGSFKLDLTDKQEGFYSGLARDVEEARLPEVRMPKAGGKNSGIAAKLKSLYSKASPDIKILRVNLDAANWDVIDRDILNRPIRKRIGAYIASKDKQGKCSYQFIAASIYSDNGKKFGNPVLDSTGDITPILCKNVAK